MPLGQWYGVSVAGDRVDGLRLPENGLAGTIPAALTGLTMLGTLDLRWNALTGTIPDELGRLSRLRSIDLRSNELDGAIPPSLRDLGVTDLHLRYAGVAGDLCVPDDPQLVTWLGDFPMAPGAPAVASFIPCERTVPDPGTGPSVRVVYAIPRDRPFSQDYSDGIQRGIELLQWWVSDQLLGANSMSGFVARSLSGSEQSPRRLDELDGDAARETDGEVRRDL